MKGIALCLLTVALHVCTPALAQRVSIHGRGLSLEQVFMEIRRQAGLEFLYSNSLLAGAHPVTLDVQEAPVEVVLKSCLQGQGLGYTIHDGTVVIFKSGASVPKERVDSAVVISGRVVDGRGQAVAMASVLLLHGRAGTETNGSGAFSLKLKKPVRKDSLSISCVGYQGRRIAVGEPEPIVLQPAATSLDESIVVAYGTTSDRFRTGAISTVGSADIEKSPTANVLEALAGRVPGLYVRQDGGNPTNPYTTQLRGDNVIPPNPYLSRYWSATDQLSKPLIVVDGIPLAPDVTNLNGENTGLYNITGLGVAGIQSFGAGDGGLDDLYWLNPQDVASISVLKDAEATAPYGSRAANGVILITTKKGKPGRATLRINVNTGVNADAHHVDLMNTRQYLAMRHEAWNNSIGAGLSVDGSDTPNVQNSPDLLVFDTTRNTDWQKFLLGSAPVTNLGLELSGGKDRMAYRFSAGYNGWKSSFPAPRGVPAFREDKETLAFNTTSRSKNNKFKAVNSLLLSFSASIQPGIDPDVNLLMSPDAPALFNAAGNLNWSAWPVGTADYMSYLDAPFRANWFTLFGSTNLSYELFPSLVVSVVAGYSKRDGREHEAIPSTAYDPNNPGPEVVAVFGKTPATDFDLEPNVRYSMRHGRHYLEALAGGSYQMDEQLGMTTVGTGYTSDAQLNSLAAATEIASLSDIFVQRKAISALARVSYRWSDAILVDLSGRRDGSSSFGPGKRYGNFGSVGAGWIFTESSWLKGRSWLPFGKIRASYGVTGIESVEPYGTVPTFDTTTEFALYAPNAYGINFSDGDYQGSPTYQRSQNANSTLHWAQATSLDLGTDLYFFSDERLKFSFQWYTKTTGDQLVDIPVAAVTGNSTILTDFPAVPTIGATDFLRNWPGKVRNNGIETTIDYNFPRRLRGINWSLSLNLAANQNKLVAFPGLANFPLFNELTAGQTIAELQVFPSYLNKTLGVWMDHDSTHPETWSHGVNNYPVFTGGLQSAAAYRGWGLSVSCTFAKQKGFSNLQNAGPPGSGEVPGQANQLASVITKKHWQSPADAGIGGGLYAASPGYFDPVIDIYWRDASYVAIKNATLTYVFPSARLKKTGLAGLSFYARADNLLQVSLAQYKGFNPERPGDIYPNGSMPLRRVIVGGFTVTL